MPARGIDREQLLARMDTLAEGDADWRAGKTWCLVYSAGEEHGRFVKEAHNRFFSENALNPFAFKSLRRMESETIAALGGMLHGPESVCGALTAGGTESILLAMATYRERARKLRPWILRPEVIVPTTAHPAFDKAAHYFGLRLRKVGVDRDYRVDVRTFRRKINRNTIGAVVSAPHYCQGVVDPVEEVAAVCKRWGVPVHVDACVGGMMLPWVEKLGREVPRWDFRVPGVTSISLDLHKYGYAAKGASAVMYRSMDVLKHQFFVTTDWPGGIYVSANVLGTRPGGPVAAAWAAVFSLGEEGYLELTRKGLEVRDRVMDGVASIDGIEVFGRPHGTLVSVGSSDDLALPIFAVADQLSERGWHFDRHQNPNCIHLTCGVSNLDAVDAFLVDLREATEHVRAHPELGKEGQAATYGMMAKIPLRGMVKQSVLQVMEHLYAPGVDEPDMDEATKSDPRVEKLAGMVVDAVDAVNRFRGRT